MLINGKYAKIRRFIYSSYYGQSVFLKRSNFANGLLSVTTILATTINLSGTREVMDVNSLWQTITEHPEFFAMLTIPPDGIRDLGTCVDGAQDAVLSH